jgi:ESF2/ABP1 family protein
MKALLRQGFKGEEQTFLVKSKKVSLDDDDSDDVFGDDSESESDNTSKKSAKKAFPGSDDDKQHQNDKNSDDKDNDSDTNDAFHMNISSNSNTKDSKNEEKEDRPTKKVKKLKKSKKKLKSYEKYQKAQEKRGVVYLARIPPYMKPMKVQHLLEQYGKVTNLHCVEEDRSLRRRRKRAGGNSKKNYIEGWIEYEDKKTAKMVARCLNNTQIGGKKQSYYYHDIWNLKYLRGFKWRHLTEKIQYERRIRDQKLRAEINRAKRENNAYIAQIEKGREIKKMEERKLARNNGGSMSQNVEDERNKIRRQFRQIAPIGDDDVRQKLKKEMLGQVFSSRDKNGKKRKREK